MAARHNPVSTSRGNLKVQLGPELYSMYMIETEPGTL